MQGVLLLSHRSALSVCVEAKRYYEVRKIVDPQSSEQGGVLGSYTWKFLLFLPSIGWGLLRG